VTSPERFAEVDGEPLPLVPPGEYQLSFEYFETAVMFGRAPKLILRFKVVSLGQHFQVQLARFFNVKKLLERPKRSGRFLVGRMSSFTREYARLFPLPGRLDRMPMSRFENHVLIGRVRTVETGGDQKRLPAGLEYSVIDELLRIEQ
jgi:hypothetical protein